MYRLCALQESPLTSSCNPILNWDIKAVSLQAYYDCGSREWERANRYCPKGWAMHIKLAGERDSMPTQRHLVEGSNFLLVALCFIYFSKSGFCELLEAFEESCLWFVITTEEMSAEVI